MNATATEVARARRVSVRTHLADLVGHVSARSEDNRGLVVVTPGASHSRPLRVRAKDTLTVGLDGRRVSGEGDLPLGIELDLAIYRARPEVGSVVWTASPNAIAFGIVGRDVLPIPISFAEFAHAGTVHASPPSLRLERGQAEQLVRQLGGRMFLQLRGVATVTSGAGVSAALWAAHGFEELARVSRRAFRLSPAPRGMSSADVARVFGRMPSERRPSRDPLAYLPSLDIARPPPPPSRAWQADDPAAAVRRKIAIACRILAANGRLVAFLEHVSARLPGRPEIFAMSPAIDFASMTPEDVGMIAMAGDCEPVEGPYPPAPFRWFHRDVFVARPDVEAIVHTHEEYGRVFVAAGGRPLPVFRNGAEQVAAPVPVFEHASLVFSAEDRSAVIALLGDGAIVHEKFHGTDFAARTIEQATVWAVQREESLAVQMRALELGEPTPLSPAFVGTLVNQSPPAARWWEFYEDALSLL